MNCRSGSTSGLGNALPPLSRFADMNRRPLLPVKVTTDQTELLIVNVIGGGGDFGEFGVTPSGAVYVLEPDTADRVFVTGLSAVLDEATDIFRSFNPGGGQFFERDGLFIADDGTDFLSAVIAREKTDTTSRSPLKKSRWQQVIAVLPWVHDEPIAEPRSTPTRRSSPSPVSDLDRPIYQLHVDFDTVRWPETGVLRRMGYKVGRNGRPTAARREILNQVLSVELVAGSDDVESYIRGWGSPGSSERVTKTCNAIATFSRNAQRRNADYSEAIADWESDLDLIVRTYGSANR